MALLGFRRTEHFTNFYFVHKRQAPQELHSHPTGGATLRRWRTAGRSLTERRRRRARRRRSLQSSSCYTECKCASNILDLRQIARRPTLENDTLRRKRKQCARGETETRAKDRGTAGKQNSPHPELSPPPGRTMCVRGVAVLAGPPRLLSALTRPRTVHPRDER